MTLTDLWRAAGSPHFGCVPGVCRITGQPDEGLPFGDWVKDTFTDHDKLLPGDIVSNAALWSFDDRSATLAVKLGEPLGERGPRMRNYSHFVTADGEWLPLSKASKQEMFCTIMNGARLACVADSGQRHLLFRCRPGCWQFEEHSLRADVPELGYRTGFVEGLLAQGFSKAEIGSGRWEHARVLACGIEHWQAAEAKVRPWRGSALFALALFLASRPSPAETP